MYQLKHPFTLICAGPSSSGKSTFVVKLLESPHMIDKKIDRVIWCYGEKNAKPVLKCKIIYVNGIPDNLDNLCRDNTIVVLDDLMISSQNSKISDLFTKGSHHKNISIILITQNIFYQSKYARNISLNAKYMVIFKNPRDKSQFLPLARQVHTDAPSELLRVYKECTISPHGYIFLDLTQEVDDTLRFRTELFNKDFFIIYCSVGELQKKNDCEIEEIEGEQAYVVYT